MQPGAPKGPWDDYISPTPGPPSPAIADLAVIARDLFNAASGANIDDKVKAVSQLRAWGHTFVRNRWNQEDQDNGRFPQSLLIAHMYKNQRPERVSALVDVLVDGSGDVWLVLKNLLRVRDKNSTPVLHPRPLPAAALARTKAGIDKDFPADGGVVVDRMPEKGEDPVSRVPLRALVITHIWHRDGSSYNGVGTKTLKSEQLKTLATFEEVIKTYDDLRLSVGPALRTPFDQIYVSPPAELPPTFFGNEAVWGTSIGFTVLSRKVGRYGGAVTGVYATSLPDHRDRVDQELVQTATDVDSRPGEITPNTLSAIIPVYGKGADDPSETIYFDALFELAPPIPRADPAQFVKETKEKVAAIRSWLDDRASRDADSEVARQLLLAARNVWLQHDVDKAVLSTMGARSLQLTVGVRDSDVGQRVIPIFDEDVWGIFENKLTATLTISMPPKVAPAPQQPTVSPAAAPPAAAPPAAVPPVVPPRIPVAREAGYDPPDRDLDPATSPGAIGALQATLDKYRQNGNVRTRGPYTPGGMAFEIEQPRAPATRREWAMEPPSGIELGTFEITAMGSGTSEPGLILGWAASSSRAGKYIKPLGGAPSTVADPQTLAGGRPLDKVTAYRTADLTLLARDPAAPAPERVFLGTFAAHTDPTEGLVAGWITFPMPTGTPDPIVGLIGGVEVPGSPNEFVVRHLFVDLARVPV